MIKVLFFIVFCVVMAFGAKSSVDSQIKNTAQELVTTEKTQHELNKKMSDNANAILRQKMEIQKQQEHLKSLEEELGDKEESYKQNIEELKSLQLTQDELKSKNDEVEKELNSAILQSVSISIMLQQKYAQSQEAIMENEALSLMLKESKNRVKDLNNEFVDRSKSINSLNEQTSSLKKSISSIEAKKSELIKSQQKNRELLTKLTQDEASYKKELSEALAKQDLLKDTLSKLNIIKQDEDKKAQEKMQREAALKQTQESIKKDGDVVKKGSSYQEVKTKLYTGAKTIAPFTPYEITKKYGAYTDPIYGIKVFNESINLKPSKGDEKVSVVFNGKVIYADKTPVLNNIVIVEHDNELHTIYANLSQIAPDIKKGAKIKKGTIIGRVNDELVFEATEQSFHINPITLFEK